MMACLVWLPPSTQCEKAVAAAEDDIAAGQNLALQGSSPDIEAELTAPRQEFRQERARYPALWSDCWSRSLHQGRLTPARIIN